MFESYTHFTKEGKTLYSEGFNVGLLTGIVTVGSVLWIIAYRNKKKKESEERMKKKGILKDAMKEAVDKCDNHVSFEEAFGCKDDDEE